MIINEIAKSSHAFIVKLNHATLANRVHRYQIYILNNNMECVPLKSKKHIMYQSHSKCQWMPDNHFAIKGADKENIAKLSNMLKKYNKNIKVTYLNGK